MLTTTNPVTAKDIATVQVKHRSRPILADGEVRVHDACGNHVSRTDGSITVPQQGARTLRR